MMSQQIPKLLFVGAGNIAQSIMRGILRDQPQAAQRILATAPTNRNLDQIRDKLGCKISLLKNAKSTLSEFDPDFVLICVKPQVLLSSISSRDLLTQLLKSIPHKCTTLSLLAGIKSQVFASAFNLPERSIVRAMLNTAAEIGSSSVFFHAHNELDSVTLDRVQQLFGLIGRPVVKLNDENLMDVATGVCGSGIAFFYEAIQAVADVSVKNGLTRTEALQVAAQLSKSAGEMLQQKCGAHPYKLRDEVTSPAGTTIYGLDKWHQQSTNQSIQAAVQASIDRAKELSSISEAKTDNQLGDIL